MAITKEKYLSQIKGIDNRIKGLQDEINHFSYKAIGVSSPKISHTGGVKGSGYVDDGKKINAIADKQDRCDKLRELLNNVTDLKDQALEAIHKLPTQEEIFILREYYINNKTFRQIEEETQISYTTWIRCKKRALKDFKLPKDPIMIFNI